MCVMIFFNIGLYNVAVVQIPKNKCCFSLAYFLESTAPFCVCIVLSTRSRLHILGFPVSLVLSFLSVKISRPHSQLRLAADDALSDRIIHEIGLRESDTRKLTSMIIEREREIAALGTVDHTNRER